MGVLPIGFMAPLAWLSWHLIEQPAARAGFTPRSPKEQKFLRRFFQKAATFLMPYALTISVAAGSVPWLLSATRSTAET
jgi:peptidoglycan/LPS O-acetylase OafA/YrhL